MPEYAALPVNEIRASDDVCVRVCTHVNASTPALQSSWCGWLVLRDLLTGGVAQGRFGVNLNHACNYERLIRRTEVLSTMCV